MRKTSRCANPRRLTMLNGPFGPVLVFCHLINPLSRGIPKQPNEPKKKLSYGRNTHGPTAACQNVPHVRVPNRETTQFRPWCLGLAPEGRFGTGGFARVSAVPHVRHPSAPEPRERGILGLVPRFGPEGRFGTGGFARVSAVPHVRHTQRGAGW